MRGKYALNGSVSDRRYQGRRHRRIYKTAGQQSPQKIGKATVQTIEGLISQTNSDKVKLLSYFKWQKIEDMTQEQAQKCVGNAQKQNRR